MMKPISYSHLRNNLAAALDEVTNDHVPLLITRERGKPAAVLMSLEDYASISETQYLLRSPKNAEALQQSLLQYETGEFFAFEFNKDGILEPVNAGDLHKKRVG